MTPQTSRDIGSRIAWKAILIGLIVGYLIFSIFFLLIGGGLKSFVVLFQVDYFPNILVGVLGLTLIGILCGRLAGYEILAKKKNETLVGIKYAFVTLITGTVIGCCVGFFQEGIHNLNTDDNPFEDYFYKPIFWIVLFGLVPALFIGTWFGKQIKKKGLQTN